MILSPETEAAAPAAATVLLDVIEACLHAKASEWIFLRELRVGTGFQNSAAQRLDAFALNCLAHTSMRRVCYEVKTSRADFLCEMKQPLKRRIGLRYSNEFYFVAPVGLLNVSELPIECGLVEVGVFPERSANLGDRALATHHPLSSSDDRLLQSDSAGALARDSGTHLAIRGGDVAQPAEDSSGKNGEAAEPATITVRRGVELFAGAAKSVYSAWQASPLLC